MKKLLFIVLFFIWLNNTFAWEVEFLTPVWWDMAYKPSIFWPFSWDYWFRIINNTQSATQFCLQNNGTYISHAWTSITTWQYLYFSSSWMKTTSSSVLSSVVCNIPEPEIITTYEIIDKNDWINKKIFDENFIKNYYSLIFWVFSIIIVVFFILALLRLKK